MPIASKALRALVPAAAEPVEQPPPRSGRRPLDGRKVLVRLAGVVGRVPRYLKLGWDLSREPTVPTRGKAALAGALGYAVSPIDPLPGIVPVLGQLDDLAVLLVGVRAALRSAPPDVAAEYLTRHGLSYETLDADLLTVRAALVWLAHTSGTLAARAGKALLRAAVRRLDGSGRRSS